MKNVFLTFIAVLLISTEPARSSGGGTVDVSGGGHGVLIQSKVYLLDFYEAFSIKGPALLKPLPRAGFWKTLLAHEHSTSQTADLLDGIANQFAQIESIDAFLAIVLFEAYKMYQWSWVEDQLALVSPIDTIYDSKSILQLATRKGRTIYIHQASWDMMESNQKIGLLFHEIISSLLAKMPVSRERQINSYFFDPHFLQKKPSEQRTLLANALPLQKDFYRAAINFFFTYNLNLSAPKDYNFSYLYKPSNGNDSWQLSPYYQNSFESKLNNRIDLSHTFYNFEEPSHTCRDSGICRKKLIGETWGYFYPKIQFANDIGSVAYAKLNWSIETQIFGEFHSPDCKSFLLCPEDQSPDGGVKLRKWLFSFQKSL